MRVGSLFSGIGGMDAGLARVGFDHVFFCESEPYRRDVLRARFPGVPVYDDVRTLFLGEPARGASSVGDSAATDDGGRQARTGLPVRPDLLCGGFPCQDLSVAGKRAGLAGERSGLFFEFARVIGIVRPRWVLLENVPGLLSSNGGRDFGVVLETLADLGYGVAWRVVDSRFFGVPQRRRRVFILGTVADGDPRAAAECAGAVLAVGSRCDRHPATGTEARQGVAAESDEGAGDGRIAGTLTKRDRNARGADAAGAGLMIPMDEAYQCQGSNVGPMGALRRGNGNETGGVPFVAVPLTKGSASGEGVNPPGRRQEDDVNIVAFDTYNQSTDAKTFQTLRDPNGTFGDALPAVAGVGVRRLTPRECERLQGLDDDWTQLGDTKDSPRYSAIGDAVTANVAEWIGGRIKEAA